MLALNLVAIQRAENDSVGVKRRSSKWETEETAESRSEGEGVGAIPDGTHNFYMIFKISIHTQLIYSSHELCFDSFLFSDLD